MCMQLRLSQGTIETGRHVDSQVRRRIERQTDTQADRLRALTDRQLSTRPTDAQRTGCDFKPVHETLILECANTFLSNASVCVRSGVCVRLLIEAHPACV